MVSIYLVSYKVHLKVISYINPFRMWTKYKTPLYLIFSRHFRFSKRNILYSCCFCKNRFISPNWSFFQLNIILTIDEHLCYTLKLKINVSYDYDCEHGMEDYPFVFFVKRLIGKLRLILFPFFNLMVNI